MNIYDFVSPMDFRYYGADPSFFERLRPYVSEAAFLEYQRRVETALILAFRDLDNCRRVYEEEKRTGHIIRALVNSVTRKISAEAGNFVHLFLTSNDTTDTATSLRFQELLRDVPIPDLLELQDTLIGLAEQHASTRQIDRTHGQHFQNA